jgi:hypothetical protein
MLEIRLQANCRKPPFIHCEKYNFNGWTKLVFQLRNEQEKVCNGSIKLICCQCQTTFTETSTSKAHRSTTLEEKKYMSFHDSLAKSSALMLEIRLQANCRKPPFIHCEKYNFNASKAH